MREEDRIQITLIKHLRYRSVPGAISQCVNNNAQSAEQGGYLNAMGRTKGFPDLIHIIPPHGKVVFHELKSKKGKKSPEQKALHEKIHEAGALVITSYGIDEAIRDCITIGLIRG